MKRRNNSFFRLTLLCLCSFSLIFSGCFRVIQEPKSFSQIAKISQLEQRNAFDDICSYLMSKSLNSPIGHYYYGKCFEAKKITKHYYLKFQDTKDYYLKGAECGDQRSVEELKSLGQEVPDIEYSTGDLTFYPAWLNKSCGYDTRITPFGWVVSPLAVPLVAVGTVLVIAGTIVFLGACSVVAPIFNGRCM